MKVGAEQTKLIDFGSRLKFFRLQKNLTQEELAQGIISVSYLSKIENNLTTPSNEVLNLLSARLEINLYEQEDEALMNQIFNWYYKIRDGDMGQSKDMYETLGNAYYMQSSKTFIYYTLFKARYLLANKQFDEGYNELSKVEQYKDIFEVKMHYFFQKFQAVFFYIKNKFHDAIESLKMAEKHLQRSTNLDAIEKADLYYLFGLTYSQLMRVPVSITYTKESLAIYQSIYHYKRSAECQILLGISYRRIGEYEKAEESYVLAWKIAELSNNKSLQAVICHNLGNLYSDKKQHEKAIKEFKNSYKLKKNTTNSAKLNSVYSIIDEYFELGFTSQAKEWLEIGKGLITDDRDHEKYKIAFRMMEYILSSRYDELDTYFLEIALPYFRKQHMKEFVIKFSERLAVHFESTYKYKKSSFYYSLCYKELI